MKMVKRFTYSMSTHTFTVEWTNGHEEAINFSKWVRLCRENPEAPIYSLIVEGN